MFEFIARGEPSNDLPESRMFYHVVSADLLEGVTVHDAVVSRLHVPAELEASL